MNNIFLIEDHHEAIKIWKEKRVKNLDLVHIDAHLDFGFHPAKPIQRLVQEAKSLKELKRSLEYSLAFLRYEKDFDRQTNIGNYIYPAMNEGIVRDFYWVIPGEMKVFKESLKDIKGLVRNLSRQDPYRQTRWLRPKIENGIISSQLLGRRFVVCILERLPIFKDETLLDIDTDFLVTHSIKKTDSIPVIRNRRPWILPERLAGILKEKVKNPLCITIAYSVNGGWTPIRYRHLGDELAFRLSGSEIEEGYRHNLEAAEYFRLFEDTGQRKYYQKAIRLNPAYRGADNNYGPLYLSLGRLAKAEKEFRKIIRADPLTSHPLIGLGNIYLTRRDYAKARDFYIGALKKKRDIPEGLFGLAKARFSLKEYQQAKRLFERYQKNEPMHPQSYYYLGRIYEREKRFDEAVIQYRHAMRLGLNNIDILYRLLKVGLQLESKDDIIRFVLIRYREFKKGFDRAKRLGLKRRRDIKVLREIEKKIGVLERRMK